MSHYRFSPHVKLMLFYFLKALFCFYVPWCCDHMHVHMYIVKLKHLCNSHVLQKILFFNVWKRIITLETLFQIFWAWDTYTFLPIYTRDKSKTMDMVLGTSPQCPYAWGQKPGKFRVHLPVTGQKISRPQWVTTISSMSTVTLRLKMQLCHSDNLKHTIDS